MRLVGSVVVGLLVSACSWARFDDLQEDAPVVILEKPEKLGAGFGVTVATASFDEKTRALVAGAAGRSAAAAFALGFSDDPGTEAVDTGSCDQEGGDCYLADRIAGMARANTTGGEGELCFALGIGITPASAEEHGIMARCSDKTEYTLPVPPRVLDRLIDKEVVLNETAAPLVLFADRAAAPALIAGAESKQLAWFYGALEATPVLLEPPVDDPKARGEDYGAAVASVRLADGDARLLAVGAPGAERVWLFRSDDGLSADPVGCLGGPRGFGRRLTSGDVDGDGLDDLVVADATNVTVYSGEALDQLAPAAEIECTLAALPPGSLIASFGCGTRGTVTGCEEDFVGALTVADLDGDDDGEVVVGAPELEVRDESRAGALLIYDAEGDRSEELTEVLFLASREKNDRLGAAVATAETRERDVLVAGVPGSGRAAVFYCSSLVPDDKKGERCD